MCSVHLHMDTISGAEHIKTIFQFLGTYWQTFHLQIWRFCHETHSYFALLHDKHFLSQTPRKNLEESNLENEGARECLSWKSAKCELIAWENRQRCLWIVQIRLKYFRILCKVGIGISGIEPSGSATRQWIDFRSGFKRWMKPLM
jgi:hypothetical protein